MCAWESSPTRPPPALEAAEAQASAQGASVQCRPPGARKHAGAESTKGASDMQAGKQAGPQTSKEGKPQQLSTPAKGESSRAGTANAQENGPLRFLDHWTRRGMQSAIGIQKNQQR